MVYHLLIPQQKNWNYSSTESVCQQWQRVLQNFLELGEFSRGDLLLDENHPRLPTLEEIDTILQPWRSDEDLRRKAYYMSKDKVLVFLWAHYNPDDDGKMHKWVHGNDMFENNPYWVCLDNPYLFNFGSGWQRVYKIMPEVASPVAFTQRPADSSRLGFKRSLHTTKQKNLHRRIETTEKLAIRFHNIATATYIVIADQEAFQTGQLRLLCLDDQRNIVRQVRIDRKPAQIRDFISNWDSFLGP
ncbi:unnamed protein product [Penicillium salamii]|uniref:Uncharacterized protein n=1 Tax=Penicillium salamii TaxID=1612424 RepID=A0A9W4IXF4_9EURO|nr:hypothetical protein HAV15_012130 [Penicillium sp. str. \